MPFQRFSKTRQYYFNTKRRFVLEQVVSKLALNVLAFSLLLATAFLK